MARPPLPIGSHGTINTRQEVGGRHRAYTNYRDTDGVTRRVERWATTQAKATRALRVALTHRGPAHRGGWGLSPDSTLADAAALYLNQVRRDNSPGTHARYASNLTVTILPALGQLRLRECTVGRLGDFLDSLKDTYAADTRRGIKAVLAGVLQTAVRREALTANPARHLDRITGGQRRTVAYTREELLTFLDRLDHNTMAHNRDLVDLIRLLFGVGLRIGEALALRWRDLNLTPHPVTVDGRRLPARSVWVNGSVVAVTGVGVVRNAGKTVPSNRVLSLPSFLVHLLLARRPTDAGDTDAVFPPPGGQQLWRYTSNVRRSLRTIRTQIGFPDFHCHIARATVATLLKDAGMSDLQVADYLGHAQVRTTQDHYFGRDQYHPEAAAHLDAAHRGPA
jgi:integrase